MKKSIKAKLKTHKDEKTNFGNYRMTVILIQKIQHNFLCKPLEKMLFLNMKIRTFL